ncbi:hypothetical protein OG921_14920 [Aldersonia sp. NBC_00410]|uniref:hypothetical protein n=1 Tax=Aldersonia sp. NBC_00410 TaxID=2975954 RepID=UPI00224FC12B|nr:hypothetical protein [Aldersonia sp. NBC_00410]MCX5044461.1 hypothetical protein [Aldersonia sp. NBC_00410]
MTSIRPKISGEYAAWRGNSYFAEHLRDTVLLYSSSPDLPEGFEPSGFAWFVGQRRVPVGEVDRLTRVKTTCTYRGEPFEITRLVGDTAYLAYIGRDLDKVVRWDGMERPDKYDIYGEAPLGDLADFQETATEIPLPGQEPR